MISVIVCSRDLQKSNIHKEHIINSTKVEIEYIVIDNSNNDFSLCSAYNTGVQRASGDILIFMHDDVFLITQNWAELIIQKFETNKNLGALGVAGANYLSDNDAFWCSPGKPFVKGKVIHELERNHELIITIFSDTNRDEEVVILDGLFIAIRANLFENEISFDEETFKGFHLYDLDICMQIHKNHMLIVTEDILVKHMSSGVFGPEWKSYADIFLKKYSEILPISCTSEIPDLKNRSPFESAKLENLLKDETISYISSLGKATKDIIKLFNDAQTQFNNNNFIETLKLIDIILHQEPKFYNGWHLQGLCFFKTGKIDQAINALNKALEFNDKDPMLYFNLGTILIEKGQYSKALTKLNDAIHLKSDFIPALHKITQVLSILGELSIAKKTCKTILKHSPNNYEAYNNLGNICKNMGEIEEALQHYQKAIKIKPDYYIAYSNLLLNIHYLIDEPKLIWNHHKTFGNLFKNDLNNIVNKSHKHNKKIRIGYLSPDFRTHSVSYFIKPILENHSHEIFDIFCYNDTSNIDNTTNNLESLCENWQNVKNLNNDQLTDLIKKDELDIIIDLAGHSGENRITIFSRKLAPIQITYLGYPDTTGLSQVDYRITDYFSESENSDVYYSEELLKLKHSFLCYSPVKARPNFQETPSIKNGYITFGSFNNFSKISDEIIRIWVNILNEIPDSILLIKCRALNDNVVKKILVNRFQKHGIGENRLTLKGYTNSKNDHLKCYNDIDIALDTFPYNGTTTTCEALSMGVPVISLNGKTHASKVGTSILSNSNLTNLIASNGNEYVFNACDLTKDILKLNKLRSDIFTNFPTSQICDSKSFIKEFEDTLIRVNNESIK